MRSPGPRPLPQVFPCFRGEDVVCTPTSQGLQAEGHPGRLVPAQVSPVTPRCSRELLRAQDGQCMLGQALESATVPAAARLSCHLSCHLPWVWLAAASP